MSIGNHDVKLSSFPVGDAATNVTAVTFGHRSGKFLATGSEDSKIHIYLIGQMTSLLTSQCQSSGITALRFSNEENMLASGSRSGVVKICDLESQKVIYPGDHKACIRSMEYFPSSNNFLATGSVDGSTKLWDPRRKGVIFNYKGHNGAINALRFSPDGRYLITASDDTAIRMWDVTAGKMIKAFQEHQGPVFAVEYHPKELLFASAGADRRVKFWDLEKLQLVSETEIEKSAIKCLAFEPINANCIFTGSNDTLRAHSWEPIQLLDSVSTNWKNVVDMIVHKNQLYGASFVQNKVYLGSIDLSNVKTKPTAPPVREHFPGEPKVSTAAAAASVSSTRRSQYPTTAVKDEHVKVQPEPASMVSPEEARATVADSVLIDNQADYDRIFRGGNLLKHSANRPDVAVENTSPFNAQSRPVSKASPPPPPSVSPPPQVEVLMPPIQMPTEQPRTNEQLFASLSKGHQKVNSIQQKRMRNLTLLTNLSRASCQTSFQAIVASHDVALESFMLRFVSEKLSKRDWSLELCTQILPAIRDLIKSHYHWNNLLACQTLEKVLSNFGRMIFDNVGAKSIGVDISQQERRDKCQSCHYILHEIRLAMEEQLKTSTDSSLRQAYDDNLRLLNACERS